MQNIFESAATGELEDENRRLRARVVELIGERDALIERSVCQAWVNDSGYADQGWRVKEWPYGPFYRSKEDAIAAVRKAAGLDRTEAPDER